MAQGESPEINSSLAALRGEAIRIAAWILAGSLLANAILSGIIFYRGRQADAIRLELVAAKAGRAQAIEAAEAARTNAEKVRGEAAGALRSVAAQARGIQESEARYSGVIALSAALARYREAGGDLRIELAPGSPPALRIEAQEAPETLKRIQVYPALRAAHSGALQAIWTFSNALEATKAEAGAERRAREAADRLSEAWKKSASSGEASGRLQGAAVAGLAAVGAIAGGILGKDPAWALLGGLAGAGGGLGIALAISLGKGPPKIGMIPIR